MKFSLTLLPSTAVLSLKWVFQLFSISLTGMDTVSPSSCGSIHVASIGPDGFGLGGGVGAGGGGDVGTGAGGEVGAGAGGDVGGVVTGGVEPAHPARINTSETTKTPIPIFLSIYCIPLFV